MRTRHVTATGIPVGGELFHERVKPFPGGLYCDKYAAALPVSDLDASIDWYGKVFGAQYLPQFDHVDDAGTRYAVIINVPGLPVPVELRWAPVAAGAIGGYDPIDLAVDSADALDQWARHLDACGIEHSPVINGGAGHLMVLADPDGIFIRIGGGTRR